VIITSQLSTNASIQNRGRVSSLITGDLPSGRAR
jgi:hypothetical protein